jgi:hypothetical protein
MLLIWQLSVPDASLRYTLRHLAVFTSEEVALVDVPPKPACPAAVSKYQHLPEAAAIGCLTSPDTNTVRVLSSCPRSLAAICP